MEKTHKKKLNMKRVIITLMLIIILIFSPNAISHLKENEKNSNIYDKTKNMENSIENKIEDKAYKINNEIDNKLDNKNEENKFKNQIENNTKENTTEEENKSIIYLTFDDGPSLDITPKILDILKEENVKATFFIIDYNDNKKTLIERTIKEGHSIGLHGTSHDYKKIYSSLDAGIKNFTSLNEKVKNDFGVDTKIIRFPGGSSNTVSKFNPGIMTELSSKLLALDYIYFDWNVCSGDSGDVKTKEGVYKSVTKNLKHNRNNIVLMHDFAKNTKTLNALRDIIKYGKENGYIFKEITQETKPITQKIVN